MAKKGDKGGDVGQESGWVRVCLALIAIIGRSFDRLGVPMTVVLILLFLIWTMGTAATQNDFIRELLFGEITPELPVMRIFFGAVFLLIILAEVVRKEDKGSESTEMKRLANLKSSLQEKLAGRSLSHSEARPTSAANAASDTEVE